MRAAVGTVTSQFERGTKQGRSCPKKYGQYEPVPSSTQGATSLLLCGKEKERGI